MATVVFMCSLGTLPLVPPGLDTLCYSGDYAQIAMIARNMLLVSFIVLMV